MRRLASFLLVGVCIVLTAGCQSDDRPANMPKLYPVSITVKQAGTPVVEASLRLVPENASMPWSCGGSTDKNGVAEIRTLGQYPGAPAGKYKVTVSKIDMSDTSASDLTNLDRPAAKSGDSFDLIPPEYGSPTQTTLLLEVGESSNKQEFDLGPAVRIKRRGPPN